MSQDTRGRHWGACRLPADDWTCVMISRQPRRDDDCQSEGVRCFQPNRLRKKDRDHAACAPPTLATVRGILSEDVDGSCESAFGKNEC